MDGNQVLPNVHHFFTKFTIRSVLYTLAAFFFKPLNSLFQLLFKVAHKNQLTTLQLKDILSALIEIFYIHLSKVRKAYNELCFRIVYIFLNTIKPRFFSKPICTNTNFDVPKHYMMFQNTCLHKILKKFAVT